MSKYPTLDIIGVNIFPNPQKPDGLRRLIHYIIVGSFLLHSWIPLMNFFGGNVELTALAWLGLFVILDSLAHQFILGEK